MTLRNGDDLTGKVALVTGAGKNIGRATARSLAAGGASVMVHALTSESKARETVKMIEDEGGKAACFLADVTDPAQVDALVQTTVDAFGRLDILVNNHTIRGHKSILELPYDEWRQLMKVVLDGTWLCCKAAAPHMIEAGGGTIITFGGQGAVQGQRGGTHSSAAKLGIVGMTKALALDLAPHGITANCIVPGLIDTLGANDEVRHTTAKTPIGRIGRPDEIAAMIRMLCGPEIRYMTGQTLHMNGGGLMP